MAPHYDVKKIPGKARGYQERVPWPETNHMLLNISRLDHSCVPNAEMDTETTTNTSATLLYAVEPIAQGEEILHCYHGNP
ncbi:hypothetical protein B0A55_00589 [Friedmanniomyces simplex]|uniref:SET domain-containing protein n=1 Tax=Friedmanniomyces simplex TaxID=329884 RepID=A0A4V5NIK8_9PEZI|nr:hypothetical protein B0A55_00589 [Friedmanniomyces simplex]